MSILSWTKCYSDEDAKALGLNNRDDAIKKECKDLGKGADYTGKWEDCGNWKFRGECKTPKWSTWTSNNPNGSPACTAPGIRKNHAKLLDIQGDWNESCNQAINHTGFKDDIIDNKKCIHKGGSEGMWGEVFTKDPVCAGTWGTFRNECSEAGKRKYFSKLTVPDGLSWEDTCAYITKSPTLLDNGQSVQGRCVKRDDGMYAEWISDDTKCTGATSADISDLSTGVQSTSGALTEGAVGGFTKGIVNNLPAGTDLSVPSLFSGDFQLYMILSVIIMVLCCSSVVAFKFM